MKNDLLLRWEFPRIGYMEVHGSLIGLSIDDISDAVEALLILKRQCVKIQERQQGEMHCAADVPMECR